MLFFSQFLQCSTQYVDNFDTNIWKKKKWHPHHQMVWVAPPLSPPPASAHLISYLHFLLCQNKTITNRRKHFLEHFSHHIEIYIEESANCAFIFSQKPQTQSSSVFRERSAKWASVWFKLNEILWNPLTKEQ